MNELLHFYLLCTDLTGREDVVCGGTWTNVLCDNFPGTSLLLCGELELEAAIVCEEELHLFAGEAARNMSRGEDVNQVLILARQREYSLVSAFLPQRTVSCARCID